MADSPSNGSLFNGLQRFSVNEFDAWNPLDTGQVHLLINNEEALYNRHFQTRIGACAVTSSAANGDNTFLFTEPSTVGIVPPVTQIHLGSFGPVPFTMLKNGQLSSLYIELGISTDPSELGYVSAAVYCVLNPVNVSTYSLNDLSQVDPEGMRTESYGRDGKRHFICGRADFGGSSGTPVWKPIVFLSGGVNITGSVLNPNIDDFSPVSFPIRNDPDTSTFALGRQSVYLGQLDIYYVPYSDNFVTKAFNQGNLIRLYGLYAKELPWDPNQ